MSSNPLNIQDWKKNHLNFLNKEKVQRSRFLNFLLNKIKLISNKTKKIKVKRKEFPLNKFTWKKILKNKTRHKGKMNLILNQWIYHTLMHFPLLVSTLSITFFILIIIVLKKFKDFLTVKISFYFCHFIHSSSLFRILAKQILMEKNIDQQKIKVTMNLLKKTSHQKNVK